MSEAGMTYYNDVDKSSVRWLESLIVARLISDGDVDGRSIANVCKSDLQDYQRAHFFAGIGGWERALQLARWPEDLPVWTGSCPCQSFSSAGKGLGFDDPRGKLWTEFFRLIKECRPKYIFGEQVAAAIRYGWVDRVQADLEAEGYTVGYSVLGAHSVGAPHKRQRLYWGAARMEESSRIRWRGWDHANTGWSGRETETEGPSACMAHPHRTGFGESHQPFPTAEEHPATEFCSGLGYSHSPGPFQGDGTTAPTRYRNTADPAGFWANSRLVECAGGKQRRISVEPSFFPLAHGLPRRVAKLRGLGNAIVPQCASVFIKAFMQSIVGGK